MFDEHSRRTIEECLRAAERAMRRAGIETDATRTRIDKPHGFTNLAYFDDDFARTRMYRRGGGEAEFRNFIRGSNTDQHHRQALDLLMQLRRLEPFFREHLADRVEIPDLSGSYVRDLHFGNTAAWPDDLYYNLTYKAEEAFRNSTSYMPPRFLDLSEIAPVESREVPGGLRYEHAIKNAIDLVCMGPWAGISVPKIIRALERLHDDVSRGKKDVEPPILQCLEPRVTRRLTVPLWRAGRFHGVFSVIMGGSLDQLKPLDGLVADCMSVSHLLFSVLQRERERRARSILRSGLTEDRPLNEVIGDAVHALGAPHYIRAIAATDGGPDDGDGALDVGEADDPPLRFSIQETLFGQLVRIDVELFDEKRPIIRNLMEIYLANELRRIHWELTAAPAISQGIAGSCPLSRSDTREFASRTLRDYTNDASLPNKEYFMCFVCLAILDQQDAQIVKISGQKVYKYQEELAERYGISRNQEPNRRRNPNSGAAQNNIYLSHLATKAALDYVQEKFPGLDIVKRHNLIEIRFGTG